MNSGWWGGYISRPCGWLLLLCLLIHSGNALAQEETQRIAYGESVSGTLDDEQYRALYIFSGRQGEIITVQMTTLEGDLDPYIALIDSQGRGIAFSDDGGEGAFAALNSVSLPLTGDYFLIATRFGHEQGSTAGTYQLSLQRVGATTPAGSILRYGDTVIGTVSDDSPQVIYAFEGKRGDVINLRMQRTSGNLDPLVDLANAQGQVLISGDDDPTASGTLNAGIINFTLPQSGFYIISATRYGRDSGVTHGSFLLKVESVPESQRGLAPANAILLDYGAQISASIDGTVPQRFYFFEGKRGDVVMLDMGRQSGNLTPLVLLLDANLTELIRVGEAPPANRARINAYVLPQTGVYYVMVTRAEFSAGRTEGDFDLTLEGRAGIVGSNYPEIFDESEIAGSINDILPHESFVFQGEAGETITLRLEVTSGDLAPLLTLYLGGKQIAFDSNLAEDASINSFELPETGVYRVEVSRLNREAGSTEGSYVLSLDIR